MTTGAGNRGFNASVHGSEVNTESIFKYNIDQ